MDDLLNVHPEVALALARGGAVVALESTLLAHGMPPDRRVQVQAGDRPGRSHARRRSA